ncbi:MULTISPECIES: N-acetylmuramoyl-L-alanine amidase [unclassified Paenibacillus]|uniref:N-acetylmuramoyl-L-alanine amidase n=1 Tax=unclassified Paenibacillus TaxID=185978 RepID=UPI0036C0B366
MKKYGLWAVLLILTLVLVFPVTGHAATPSTHINLDGSDLAMPGDVQVQIVNGSVMVPLRLVTEQLGYGVKWDNISKTATIEQGGRMLTLVVNQKEADADGVKIQLDNPSFLSKGTTFVPLRFIGEQTGATVGWDNITKTVYLTSPAQEIGVGNGGSPSPTPAPGGTPSQAPDNGSEVTTPGGSATPPVNTTAASLTDMSFNDNKLIISLNGNVNPSIFAMTGTDRIVIDLPNTIFGQAFSQRLPLTAGQSGQVPITGYPDVTGVRYSLFSSTPSTIRVVLDLNSAKTYGVTNANDGLLIIDLNGTGGYIPDPGATPIPTPTPDTSVTPLPGDSGKKVIVLDAGHGGSDPGAGSLNKLKEKDFTLAVVLKIEALLKNEPNTQVVLTRSGDTYPTLQERAKLANNLNASLFVSVHGNSPPVGTKTSPSGTETHYSRKESLQFAQIVHKYLIQATGLPDRGIKQTSLHVTRETKMPAILLEVGFLTNAKDEALMYSDDFQQKVAEAVVAGIKEYLNM